MVRVLLATSLRGDVGKRGWRRGAAAGEAHLAQHDLCGAVLGEERRVAFVLLKVGERRDQEWPWTTAAPRS
eukprot:6162653-Prymnesium_polylepis.2